MNKRLFRTFWFGLGAFLCTTAQRVCAQDLPSQIRINSESYSLFHWSTENGLPQNNVQQIIEDHNGQLWFTTFDGLAKFDGTEFIEYNESNTQALTSGFAISMVLDSSGVIWMTTENEIVYLNKKEVVGLPTGKEKFKFIQIRGEIYLYNSKKVYLKEGPSFIDQQFNFQGKKLSNIVESDPLIFQLNDGFYSLKNDSLLKLLKPDRFWQLDKDLYKIQLDNRFYIQNLTDINSDSTFIPLELSSLKSKEIMFFKKFPERKSAILESLDSFYIFQNDKIKFRESKKTVGFRAITTAFIDSKERIWIGSSANGIHLFRPKVFNSISELNTKWKINGHMVYMAPDSNIWFEGGCGKIIRRDHISSELTEFQTSGCPWTVLKASTNDYWINGDNVTQQLNLDHYDKNGEIGNALIYSSFEYDSTIFLGTARGVFYLKNDVFERIKGTEGIRATYQFTKNLNNELIFSSSSGIGVIKNARLIRIFTKKDGLLTDDIRTVYQDSSCNYWIGYSKKGLGYFNGADLFDFPINDGRINKNIWSIIEDDFGFIWTNSNQGVYRYNKADLIQYTRTGVDDFNSQHFSEKDGLHSAEGNSRTQNKAFKDTKGNIWFSMISGPAYIDPSQFVNEKEYPIILEEVLIDGKKASTRHPIVKASNSQIQFKFSNANFGNNEHLSYLYNLESLDDRWYKIDKTHQIGFSELPPRDYVLRVRVAGSSQQLVIPFKTEANFWETDAFKHSSIVVVMSAIFFIGFRIRRKGRKRIAHVKRIDSELKKLELRALQSQMNPHFVFNCLSSISALYLSNDLKAANEYMSNFSALLRIILEHAQKSMTSLNEEVKMFNIYVPLEALQFDEPFDYEIDVDASIDLENTFIPSMVSHTFIENAIKHGLKPLKNRSGKLSIKVRRYGGMIVVLIEDNGIGYEKSQQVQARLHSSHKSRGLENTNKRINLINLLKDLNISVETVNLYDSNNEASGTKVTLTFPIINSNENTDS